jgi:hypothetical protein
VEIMGNNYHGANCIHTETLSAVSEETKSLLKIFLKPAEFQQVPQMAKAIK